MQSITQTISDYYQDIPANTMTTMAKSATYTFALTQFFTQMTSSWGITAINISRSTANAAIAALAALIYSLTTPIFNKIFGDNQIYFHREIIKNLVHFSLTAVILSYCTTGKVTLNALPLIAMISMNSIYAGLSAQGSLMRAVGIPQIQSLLGSAGLLPSNGSASTHLVFI